jgi:hypothetical protein
MIAARWTRDPLSAAGLKTYATATGDRLRPGQVLVEPLVSANGRYRLSHHPEQGTRMDRTDGSGVWSTTALLGELVSLGADGVLRVDANSTVLPRWSGRRWDPMDFAVAALLVRDDGDVVIVGEDGAEIWTSQTSVEEARLERRPSTGRTRTSRGANGRGSARSGTSRWSSCGRSGSTGTGRTTTISSHLASRLPA